MPYHVPYEHIRLTRFADVNRDQDWSDHTKNYGIDDNNRSKLKADVIEPQVKTEHEEAKLATNIFVRYTEITHLRRILFRR